MSIHYRDERITLRLGDCREVLPSLADESVDAVVCDPPYEIGFMDRGWDATGIAYDPRVWKQCLRVLKPGGHLLAFGAARTYHRLACAIEDAGFEIRDSIHWIYSSGMPKGQDIAKGIDRHRDDRDKILQVTAFLRQARTHSGLSVSAVDEAFGFNGMASHWTTDGRAAAVPTPEQWKRLAELLGFHNPEMDALVADLNNRKGSPGRAWQEREVVGHRPAGRSSAFLSGTEHNDSARIAVTAPASTAATRWQGWNTTLRPAHEPIVIARKTTGFNTTTANVLEHGTGALNIDGCRITTASSMQDVGRWPTNVVFSHSPDCGNGCAADCPVDALDAQRGRLASGANPVRRRSPKFRTTYGTFTANAECTPARGADRGTASRFFPVFRYEGKAPESERPRLDDGTTHTTVKPLQLMRWLCRLVTPPGGTVLDPFAGSGTTLEACVIEGFHAVGVENHQPYADLCVQRLTKPIQPTLDAAAHEPGVDEPIPVES